MRERSAGFTLLEMIIAMLIISAIVLMVYTSYSTVVQTWKRNHARAAEFRLEKVGDRLLREDWKNIVPYTFGTERGAYSFMYGASDRVAYATTHRLGAHRRFGGGIYFSLLLLRQSDDGLDLYCYKTDAPEPDLMLLVRLYQSGDNDPRIRMLEEMFTEQALWLKTVDEAVFSFDTESASETDSVVDTEDVDDDLQVLPLDKWQALEAPRRIRLSLRLGTGYSWLESELPVADAVNASDDEPLSAEDVPNPDDLELFP